MGPGGWDEFGSSFAAAADVQLFSGCEDRQTSADASQGGKAAGAMSTAFCETLRSDPSPKYSALILELDNIMRRRGYSQRPQLSSSQAFDPGRQFAISDITRNANQRLGRSVRRDLDQSRRSPSRRHTRKRRSSLITDSASHGVVRLTRLPDLVVPAPAVVDQT